MKIVTILFGVLCGAFVGFALGVLFAAGLGYWSQWSHPDDPSAFSIAIMVILTAPAGAILGAFLGGITIAKRPRLFFATFLPLAVLFLGWQVIDSTLRRIDRPRNFALEVTGTPGAEFVGVVVIDGNKRELTGNIPAKFQFEGHHLESGFALREINGANTIAVKTWADNHDLRTGTESETGIHQEMQSQGYSQTFGGCRQYWSRMSPEEVELLLDEKKLPDESWIE